MSNMAEPLKKRGTETRLGPGLEKLLSGHANLGGLNRHHNQERDALLDRMESLEKRVKALEKMHPQDTGLGGVVIHSPLEPFSEDNYESDPLGFLGKRER